MCGGRGRVSQKLTFAHRGGGVGSGKGLNLITRCLNSPLETTVSQDEGLKYSAWEDFGCALKHPLQRLEKILKSEKENLVQNFFEP